MDQEGADKGRHRRIFGSGVHAGLRLAGIQDTEGFMNQAKLKAVEQGLTGVAKKVLDALAYAEPRTPHEIGAELRRSGTAPDSRIISGCLLSLMSSGLVREPRPGYYLRIQVMNERAPKPDDHETAEASPPAAPVEPPKPELAERMAIVAGRYARPRTRSITSPWPCWTGIRLKRPSSRSWRSYARCWRA